MTREEAIKILKTERYCQEDTPNLKRVRKAYDMAIEALSAEAEQVTGKLKNPCDSLLKSDSDECKEQKSKLDGDLISRADVMGIIDSFIDNDYLLPMARMYSARCAISALPSAEAANLKQEFESADRPIGEWQVVATTKPMYDRMGVLCWGSVYKCNQCDFTTWAVEGHFSQYNYCPNCGADMRGGNNDKV